MDRYEIYFKLREICSGHLCTNCPISFINSKHKCGHGYGYSLDGNPIPLSEALKYYSIIFEKQNLRALIVRRRGYYKYERRVSIFRGKLVSFLIYLFNKET